MKKVFFVALISTLMGCAEMPSGGVQPPTDLSKNSSSENPASPEDPTPLLELDPEVALKQTSVTPVEGLVGYTDYTNPTHRKYYGDERVGFSTSFPHGAKPVAVVVEYDYYLEHYTLSQPVFVAVVDGKIIGFADASAVGTRENNHVLGKVLINFHHDVDIQNKSIVIRTSSGTEIKDFKTQGCGYGLLASNYITKITAVMYATGSGPYTKPLKLQRQQYDKRMDTACG